MKHLLTLLLALLLVACTSEAEEREMFVGWCKINNCGSLTQREWMALRDHNLLPGQAAQQQADNTAASSLPMGAAVGATMSSRSK